MLEVANQIIDEALVTFGAELVSLMLIALKFGGAYLLLKLVFGRKK